MAVDAGSTTADCHNDRPSQEFDDDRQPLMLLFWG
jgi:hypothetical protein